MRKQLRNIIISVCVVAVLVVGIVAVNFMVKPSASTSSSSASSTTSISVLKTDSSKITVLHVKNSKGEYTIRHSGGKYTIDGIKTDYLTQSNVQSTVASASNVTATKLIERNSSNLNQYGLDRPTITVDVTGVGGTTNTLEIGKENPTKDGYYITVKGSNNVYKADTSINSTFGGTKLDYVSTTISAIDSSKLAKLTAMTFSGTARKTPIVLNVEKTSSSASSSSSTPTYKMSSPHSYEVNSDNMSTLTSALESLSASSVLSLDCSAANMKKYGLDNPEYKFSFTYLGKTTVLDFGKSYKSGSTTYVPTVVEGRSIIYNIDPSTVTFYNWQLKDIASTMLYSENIDNVKSIIVTSGSESYTINLSGTGDKITGTCGSKKLSLSNIRNCYENLLSITYEGEATKPAGGSDYASITYTFHGKKAPVKMDFIKMGSRQSFWSINGQGDFYVLNSKIDTALNATRNLAAGKTVAAPY